MTIEKSLTIQEVNREEIQMRKDFKPLDSGELLDTLKNGHSRRSR